MINNILKKIEKANEVQEVKLAKHEVELALVDNLKTLSNLIKSQQGEINKMKDSALRAKKMFDDAIEIRNDLSKMYADNKTKYNKQMQEKSNLFKQIIAQAKELGIRETELPIYKDYSDSSDILNELFDLNQQNWSLISKYEI